MNKQKTLIFSLSAMLFLAVSFIVYSWTEPTTMPASYNAPINTSTSAQTKLGELAATIFRDATAQNYYVDPGGNTVLKGKITTDYNVKDSDSSNTVTNKGYVDSKIGSIATGDTTAARLYYVKGTSCPAGTTVVAKYWVAKNCTFQGGWTGSFPGGWFGPNDSAYEVNACSGLVSCICYADYYDAIICAGSN